MKVLFFLKRDENIVANGEIAHSEQFPLVQQCFKKNRLLHRRQKASVGGKRWKKVKITRLMQTLFSSPFIDALYKHNVDAYFIMKGLHCDGTRRK